MNTSRLIFVIEGIPMPKQSFKVGKYVNFTPKKTKDKINNTIAQIKAFLPENFTLIEEPVELSYYFFFPFTQQYSKKKTIVEKINYFLQNSLIPVAHKPTKPDLDNLMKLYNDCLNGLVIKDDALIVGYNQIRKFYSAVPCIIITVDIVNTKEIIYGINFGEKTNESTN